MGEFKHALSDKFEVKGYWWLPGNASCKMPGVLTYDAGRISLELFGFLQVQTVEKPREVDANVWREPIILGSGEGEEYTLYQVQPIGPRIHAPVNKVEWMYSAHYLFVGAHFESEADFAFRPLRLASPVSKTGWHRKRDRSRHTGWRRKTLSH